MNPQIFGIKMITGVFVNSFSLNVFEFLIYKYLENRKKQKYFLKSTENWVIPVGHKDFFLIVMSNVQKQESIYLKTSTDSFKEMGENWNHNEY